MFNLIQCNLTKKPEIGQVVRKTGTEKYFSEICLKSNFYRATNVPNSSISYTLPVENKKQFNEWSNEYKKRQELPSQANLRQSLLKVKGSIDEKCSRLKESDQK